jgi:trimeric autotransporter adhesin
MAAGMTTQLHAIESVNSQGTDVTTSVTWTSSNAAVATVSATGLLVGVTQGSATISAVLNKANGSLAVAVTAASVSSVAITPPNTALVTGGTQQYTLTATNSDNSTTDVTPSTTWNVTPASVASISTSGLLQAAGPGSFALTATYGTFSAAAVGTVTASALTSIAVTPATATVSSGATQQFIAIGSFADGSTEDLSKAVTWTSSNASVLTINVNGLATAVRSNNPATTVRVIAQLGNSRATASVTVNPAATITSLNVAPTSSSIADGTAEQHTATAQYSDGTQQDVTSQVTWSVATNATSSSIAKDRKSGAPVAHADASGVVNVAQTGIDSATTPGTATLQATLGNAQAQSTVIVTNATIAALQIKSSSNLFPVGSTQQIQLIGTFSDGTRQDLSLTANWQTSNPAVATITSAGVATGISAGSVTFTGSFAGCRHRAPAREWCHRPFCRRSLTSTFPLWPKGPRRHFRSLALIPTTRSRI